MYRAEVKIGLKPGVADPEGANTQKALRLLGFEGVAAVHSSRLVLIDLEAKNQKEAKEEVEAMCRRLLTNPVIHTFDLSLVKGDAPAAPAPVLGAPKKAKPPAKAAKAATKAKGKKGKR